jgi:hypothetical protein
MDTMNVIISGVLVFIIGEIIVRFFLNPLYKFKEIKGEIASTLLFHANNYGREIIRIDFKVNLQPESELQENEKIKSPEKINDELKQARKETRSVAAKLISSAESIPFYKIMAGMKIVPTKKNISSSKSNLIWLSNSFIGGKEVESIERSKNICSLLSIEFMEE